MMIISLVIIAIFILLIGLLILAASLVLYGRGYNAGYKAGDNAGWKRGSSAGYKVARGHVRDGVMMFDDDELEAFEKSSPHRKRK